MRYGANHIAVEAEWSITTPTFTPRHQVGGQWRAGKCGRSTPAPPIWLVEPDPEPLKLIEYTF